MNANHPIPRPTAASCDWEPPRKTRGALRALDVLRALDPHRTCGSPLVDLAYAAALGIAIGAAVAFALYATPASAALPPAGNCAAVRLFGGAGLVATPAGGTSCTDPETDMEAFEIPAALLRAIAAVESGSDDWAWNPEEDAHGRYQIRAAYLADANALLGTRYRLAEMHDPAKAERVVRAYLAHYGTARGATSARDLARIHNGGPRGATKRATLEYADRVLAALEGGAR